MLLAAYGLASGGYRLFIFAAIVWFVSGKFLVAGLLMAAVFFVKSAILPVARFIGYLAHDPRLERTRLRAVGVTLGGLAVALFFFGVVPFSEHFTAPGILEAEEHTAVIAATPGFVEAELVRSGDRVRAGQPLLRLRDRQLEFEMEGARAERRQAVAERERAMDQASAELKPIAGRLEAIDRRIAGVQRQIDALVLTAPHAGLWVSRDLKHAEGCWLRRGDLAGWLIDTAKFHFSAAVPQDDAASLFTREIRDAEVRLKAARRASPWLSETGGFSPGSRIGFLRRRSAGSAAARFPWRPAIAPASMPLRRFMKCGPPWTRLPAWPFCTAVREKSVSTCPRRLCSSKGGAASPKPCKTGLPCDGPCVCRRHEGTAQRIGCRSPSLRRPLCPPRGGPNRAPARGAGNCSLGNIVARSLRGQLLRKPGGDAREDCRRPGAPSRRLQGARASRRGGAPRPGPRSPPGANHGRAGRAARPARGNGDRRGQDPGDRPGRLPRRVDWRASPRPDGQQTILRLAMPPWLQPFYARCGITVGQVLGATEAAGRRAGYLCDITYSTAKEVTADFLRDRLVLGAASDPSRRHLQEMLGADPGRFAVLRGLLHRDHR